MTKEWEKEFDNFLRNRYVGSLDHELFQKTITEILTELPGGLRPDGLGFKEFNDHIAFGISINESQVVFDKRSNKFKLKVNTEKTHELYLTSFVGLESEWTKMENPVLTTGDFIQIPYNEFFYDIWMVICEPDGLSFLSEKENFMWEYIFKELKLKKWERVVLRAYDKNNPNEIRVIHGIYKMFSDKNYDFLLIYDSQNKPKEVVDSIIFEIFNLGDLWIKNRIYKFSDEILGKVIVDDDIRAEWKSKKENNVKK